jgi:hypothetical protein
MVFKWEKTYMEKSSILGEVTQGLSLWLQVSTGNIKTAFARSILLLYSCPSRAVTAGLALLHVQKKPFAG